MKGWQRVATAVLLGTVATSCAGSSSSGPTDSLSGSAAPSSATSSTSTPPSAHYTAPPTELPTQPITLSTDPPPWLPPAIVDNGADSAAYVAAAGLPYAEEMLKVHYHAHLDITVNGKAVTVPAYLGFVAKGSSVSGLAPLHTHDDSGIIHIENDVPAEFLLGQVFVEWGVKFTPTCLGPYCSGSGKELAVFVNGQRYTADPTRLVFSSHQEIAIEYGDAGKLPQPPSSYEFPKGY